MVLCYSTPTVVYALVIDYNKDKRSAGRSDLSLEISLYAHSFSSTATNNLGDIVYLCSFVSRLKQFQTSLAEHLATEVHTTMPKFKLVIVRLRQLQVNHSPRGAEQSGAQTAGGVNFLDSRGARHTDLAYVLHTSGTTGPPKIVRVPHKCILPNIIHLR